MNHLTSNIRARFLPRLLTLALLLAGLSAGSAFAQDEQSSNQPGYAADYKAGMTAAKEGQAAQEAGNNEQAVSSYTTAYQTLADVSAAAETAGDLQNADKTKRLAAQLAYRAGQLLYKNDDTEGAIEHFQRGLEIDPSYQRNQQGLTAANQKEMSGPIVEGSEALAAGNARQAIELLTPAEDTADKYFYLANAYLSTRDFGNAISAATRAFEMGGLSGSKTAQLFLTRGEAYMQNGDQEAAASDLQEAQSRGSGQVSQRAAGLLENMDAS